MADMPVARAYHELETYGGAAYAIAGFNDGEFKRVDRWSPDTGWQQASYYNSVILTNSGYACPDG